MGWFVRAKGYAAMVLHGVPEARHAAIIARAAMQLFARYEGANAEGLTAAQIALDFGAALEEARADLTEERHDWPF